MYTVLLFYQCKKPPWQTTFEAGGVFTVKRHIYTFYNTQPE